MTALHLGAPLVWGIDILRHKIKKARSQFNNNGMIEEKDFIVSIGDIKNTRFVQKIAQRIKDIANEKGYQVAIICNIGDWEDYECTRFPDLLELAKKITYME